MATLAVIVVIRTFLGWGLEVGLNGGCPWQGASGPAEGD